MPITSALFERYRGTASEARSSVEGGASVGRTKRARSRFTKGNEATGG